jgi:hypothetical protein
VVELRITREEFETSYAVNAGLFYPQLRMLGLEAVPCKCGAPDCPGWQMVSVADARQAQRGLFVDDEGNPYEDRNLC